MILRNNLKEMSILFNVFMKLRIKYFTALKLVDSNLLLLLEMKNKLLLTSKKYENA